METPKQIEKKISLCQNVLYTSSLFFPFADCHFKHREKDDFELYGLYIFRQDLFDKQIKDYLSLFGYNDVKVYCKNGSLNLKNAKVREYVFERAHVSSLYVGKTFFGFREDKTPKIYPLFISIFKRYVSNDFEINGFSVKADGANGRDAYFSGPYLQIKSFDASKNGFDISSISYSDIAKNLKEFSDNTAKYLC